MIEISDIAYIDSICHYVFLYLVLCYVHPLMLSGVWSVKFWYYTGAVFTGEYFYFLLIPLNFGKFTRKINVACYGFISVSYQNVTKKLRRLYECIVTIGMYIFCSYLFVDRYKSIYEQIK